jgi:hypothetical protein
MLGGWHDAGEIPDDTKINLQTENELVPGFIECYLGDGYYTVSLEGWGFMDVHVDDLLLRD